MSKSTSNIAVFMFGDEKMSKRRREIRYHNFETISTTHEVVGRHDAEYKILFDSFIGSDVALKNESVPRIDERNKVIWRALEKERQMVSKVGAWICLFDARHLFQTNAKRQTPIEKRKTQNAKSHLAKRQTKNKAKPSQISKKDLSLLRR